MRIAVWAIWCVGLILMSAQPVLAANQTMDLKRNGGWSEFYYRYPTYAGQWQELRFMLNTRQLQAGAEQFTGFQKNEMQDYIYRGLVAYARSMPQARISIDRIGDSLSFSASAGDEATAQEVIALLKKQGEVLENEFLAQKYYIKDTTDRYYLPDHLRITHDYTGPMRNVARAIADQSRAASMRDVADAALNFVQAIPYDRLESRATSNGAGFATPFGLLAQNRGDCDTKTVALAAMLRGLYPKLPMILVFTDQHAFVGIQVPSASGDRILTIGRRVYVLAEPAGPALLPLGRIGDHSNADLDRNYFSYVEIP
jgi:hypothetical protein